MNASVPTPVAPDSLAAAPAAGTRLGRLLVADGLLTVPMASAFVVAAGPLADLTGVGAVALRGIGIGLLGLAAVFLIVGRARPVSMGAACALVVVNVLWVGASVLALGGLWWPLTGWGAVITVAQAAVVAALAIAQITAGMAYARARQSHGDASA